MLKGLLCPLLESWQSNEVEGVVEVPLGVHPAISISAALCNMTDCCTVRTLGSIPIYRVSQKECEILRESVPYVKLYRYNPKHLYPKLNGYGDNGQRSLKL